MNDRKVILGLSDGVDSAVAAKLLKDEGYEVTGVYLNISGERAMGEARRSAETAGIAFRSMEIGEKLEKYVCKPFAEGYLRGETINPCIDCNRNMKFQTLIDCADEMGARWIATGHYARCVRGKIYTGNPDHDQSYMLCRLKEEQLQRLLLPLGDYKKEDVRNMARAMKLAVAEKPDSREICFIRDETYAEWLAKRANVPGEGDAFLNGQFFSKHNGIHRYTVGQRFGETKEGRRVYVSQIDAARNTLSLALWEELFTTEIDVNDIVWLYEAPKSPLRGQIRVRHTRWEMPDCEIIPTENGRAHVITETTLRAPAKGQTAAFYIGDLLIGGGRVG